MKELTQTQLAQYTRFEQAVSQIEQCIYHGNPNKLASDIIWAGYKSNSSSYVSKTLALTSRIMQATFPKKILEAIAR